MSHSRTSCQTTTRPSKIPTQRSVSWTGRRPGWTVRLLADRDGGIGGACRRLVGCDTGCVFAIGMFHSLVGTCTHLPGAAASVCALVVSALLMWGGDVCVEVRVGSS